MKKIVKRSLVLLLCIVMVATFAACTTGKTGGGSAAPPPAAGGSSSGSDASAASGKDTVNIAVSLDNGTLDLLNVTGFGGYQNICLTFMEPLFDFRAGAVQENVLAESVDQVSELEYTVHLREGVTFSNGNPFTASDALFSFNREKNHPNRFLDVQFVDWEKTKAVDDYTIDLWFTQFTPMNLVKMGQTMMFDEESFDEQSFATSPIGTGPYVVTDYVVNSHVTVTANPTYWGKPAGIPNINFKCMNEQSQITNALETGEVDFASGIPTKDAEYIKSLGYDIETVYPGAGIAAFFNMTPDGVLASKDARDAIAYAIDRESMADLAFSGYSTPVTWPVSTNLVDWEDKFANVDPTYSTGYDPAKAKELAEKAGLVGKELRIITNGVEYYVTIAELLQASLIEIGIPAKITNLDQATYYATIMDPSNYEIALYATSAPSMLASDLFANYPTFFTLGWADSERLPFVEQGSAVLATPDATERAAKLAELVDTFYTYSPWYGICNMPTLAARATDIEGFEWWLTGDVRYDDWSFK